MPGRPPGTSPDAVRSARRLSAVSAAVETLTGTAPVVRAAGGASGDAELSALALSTAAIGPSDLFVALPGTRSHGARFAAAARDAGALAVLTDPEGAAHVEAAGVDLTTLVVPTGDLRAVVARLAAWWYDEPSRAMTTFAVTGTNGKTTTTYLLDALGRLLGRSVGLVGTVEIRSGHRVIPSVLTTPEAPDLQRYLAEMRADGVDMLAMEVSSHALSMRRVDGIRYDVAGFTNLSQDHLDFHETFEAYFAAKAELFTPSRSRRAVVCVDDEWGTRMADRANVPVVTLATRPAVDAAPTDAVPAGPVSPDWSVRDVEASPTSTSFAVVHRDGRRVRAAISLPGGFNVSNAALAVVMLVESGVDATELDRALAAAGVVDPQVPGRMELVGTEPRTIVDFAHNPDALALALQALRPTTAGRLVVVFGATGDRDRTKRPLMGRVAAELADVVVVTDDDPHSEPPGPIRAEVLAGAREAVVAVTPEILEIGPREDAIRETIVRARATDTVLVAGRGHERWQDVDGTDRPLDDRVEARAALALRLDSEPHDLRTHDEEGPR